MVIRNTLTALITCLLFLHGDAQFRIAVGYEPGFLQAEAHNQLINRQNEAAQYVDPFRELHFMHGLTIGGRYEMEGLAVELNVSTKLANKLAKEPVFSSISDARNRINYTFYSGSFGAEALFGIFGLGTSLDYAFRAIKADFDFPEKSERFTQNTFGNKVYLSFHFKSEGKTSVSIRPYAQFFWDAWVQEPIDTFLNGSSNNVQPEKFNHFGISFLFLNGN